MRTKIDLILIDAIQRLNDLEEEEKREKREKFYFKFALVSAYTVLISLFGLVVYLSFILEIPKINLFNF